MNNPLITIITVSLNSIDTIERTILSIIEQRNVTFEYIIVDGGSSDGTVSLIEKYSRVSNCNFRYISELDKGIYDAMNKGIKMALGTYIWLVNSDDFLEPDALSNLQRVIETSDSTIPHIIVGGLNLINTDNKPLYVKPPSMNSVRESYNKLSMGIIHPSSVVHRDVYKIVGLYNDKYFISADVDFFLRSVEHNISFIFIDTALTNMTINGISNQLPWRKNIHDWKLRYSTYCKSKTVYYFYMCRSLLKLMIRKMIPRAIINNLIYR